MLKRLTLMLLLYQAVSVVESSPLAFAETSDSSSADNDEIPKFFDMQDDEYDTNSTTEIEDATNATAAVVTTTELQHQPAGSSQGTTGEAVTDALSTSGYGSRRYTVRTKSTAKEPAESSSTKGQPTHKTASEHSTARIKPSAEQRGESASADDHPKPSQETVRTTVTTTSQRKSARTTAGSTDNSPLLPGGTEAATDRAKELPLNVYEKDKKPDSHEEPLSRVSTFDAGPLFIIVCACVLLIGLIAFMVYHARASHEARGYRQLEA